MSEPEVSAQPELDSFVTRVADVVMARVADLNSQNLQQQRQEMVDQTLREQREYLTWARKQTEDLNSLVRDVRDATQKMRRSSDSNERVSWYVLVTGIINAALALLAMIAVIIQITTELSHH